jgi:hypothetical protein
MPAGGAPLGPSTPPAAHQPQRGNADAGAAAAVHSLAADFMGKAPLFEDDADFIAEVAQGASFAPGMDPQSELDLLRKKYDVWNKAFKERLRHAQGALRTANARGRSGGGGGGFQGAGGQIDLSSMPDLAAPGLLGDEAEPGSARSGDSWDGPGAAGAAAAGGAGPAAAAAAAGGKKKKGIFGLR